MGTSIAINPNTHPVCEHLNTWTSECSNCYSFSHKDENDSILVGYEYDDPDNEYFFGEFECEYQISTQCDANFKDRDGDGCDVYEAYGYCYRWRNEWLLETGKMYNEGFMTGLNCPQCGCNE